MTALIQNYEGKTIDELRARINNHPLLAFVMVAYGFTWGLWVLMITLMGHQLDRQLRSNFGGHRCRWD